MTRRGDEGLDAADALLAQMARLRVEPDEWTYGPLLEACRRARQPRRARQYGERMLRAKAPLTAFCATSLRRSLGDRGLRSLAAEHGVLDEPAVQEALREGMRRGAAFGAGRPAGAAGRGAGASGGGRSGYSGPGLGGGPS